MLGQDPRLWFAAMHQDRGQPKAPEPEEPEPQVGGPAGRRRMQPVLPAARGRRAVRRRGRALRRRGQRDPHRLHRHRRRHDRPDDRPLQLRIQDRRLDPRPGPAPGRHLAGRRPARQAPPGDDRRPRLRRRPGPGRGGRAAPVRPGGPAQPRVPHAAGPLDEPPLRAPGPGLSQQRRGRRARRADLATPTPKSSTRRCSNRCRRSSTSSEGRATTTCSRSWTCI